MFPGSGNQFNGQSDSGAPQPPNEFTLGRADDGDTETEAAIHPIEQQATDTLAFGLGAFDALNNLGSDPVGQEGSPQD